jgi:hypothetical protein
LVFGKWVRKLLANQFLKLVYFHNYFPVYCPKLPQNNLIIK